MKRVMKRLKPNILPAFELLYLGCTFFLVFEIAVPLPVSVYKGLYVALFFVLMLRVVVMREGMALFLPRYLRIGRVALPVLLLLGYLFLDAVGLLYSPNASYAAHKYYVVVPMLFFLMPTLCFAMDEAHLDRLYRTLAVSGVAVVLFSLSNYFIYEFIPLPYLRRLSTIADYNRYAENLFVALALAGYYIIGTKYKRIHRTLLLCAVIILLGTAITLSGSRRTYLLMFPALAVLLLYRLFYVVRYSATERAAFMRLTMGAGWCICALLVMFAAKSGFERYSDIKYQQEIAQGGEVSEENNVDTVIDSISTGGMFEKRAVIWRTAINAAVDYDFLDIIIGHGSGYDSYLYDHTPDPQLTEMYKHIEDKPKNWMNPHNFLLADLLNGGAVRLAVSLALAASVAASLVMLFIHRPHRALGLITAMALVYFNAFISGRYGFVYDKFYYILLACIMAEHALAKDARPTMGR